MTAIQGEIITLETKDLILRKAVFDDWPSMFGNLWSHEESARYMLWSVTDSEEHAMERMRRTIRFEKQKPYALIVALKDTDEAIGFAGMQKLEDGLYEEIGIALGPSFVHKGYGTQILKALMEEAARLGATEFQCSARTQNLASIALQESLGFRLHHVSEQMIDPRNNEIYVLEVRRRKLTRR